MLHLLCIYESLTFTLLLQEVLLEGQQTLERRPQSSPAAIEDHKDLSASKACSDLGRDRLVHC